MTQIPERLVLDLPLLLSNPANLREHWSQRAKRAKAERRSVAMRVLVAGLPRGWTPRLPKRVLFEVWRPRRFDDDALPGALKSCRDGLMPDVLHDDGVRSGHEFVYRPMQVGPARVRITVTRKEA